MKGLCYAPGTVLLQQWNALSLPEFVMITHLIVHGDNKYFVCNKLKIEDFSSHLNSFIVEQTAETLVMKSSTLHNCWPQIVHRSHHHIYVMLRCTDDVWTL